MHRLLPVVVLSFGLGMSGCIASDDPAAKSISGGAADTQEVRESPGPESAAARQAAKDVPANGSAEVRTIDESFPLSLTSVNSPVNRFTANGANCLQVLGPFQSLNGTVTLAWAAQSPLTEKLEIVAVPEEGPWFSVQGASPLTLDLKDISSVSEEWHDGLMIAGQLAGPAASAQQDFVMHLDLSYEAEAAKEIDSNWTCSMG